jgi:hypothetical protein
MNAKSERPFKVGDHVQHKDYGRGIITQDDGAPLDCAPWWGDFEGIGYHCSDTADLQLVEIPIFMRTVEVTDEQRAAYWTLHQQLVDAGLVHLLDALAPSLPEELTQGPLPTETGWYIGYDRVERAEAVLHFDTAGNGNTGHTGRQAVANPERFAPFHRLVRVDQ